MARNTARYAGGVANDGILVMSGTATIRANTARISGGGIGTQQLSWGAGASGLTLMGQHASVTHNTARSCGGIQTLDYAGMEYMRVQMAGSSTVSGNTHGGICLASTRLLMRGHSSVRGNRGGGILASDSSDWRVGNHRRVVVRMLDAATVSSNTAVRGAGIYLQCAGGNYCLTPPRILLEDHASVVRNTARITGGGIFARGGRVVLRDRASVTLNRPNNIIVRARLGS